MYHQIFPFAVNDPINFVKHIDEITDYGYIENGQDILDLSLGSCGCFPLGFKRTDIIEKVTDQLKKHPFCQADFVTTNDIVNELSTKLYHLSNGYNSIYSLSGSDSIEGAIKLVQMYHNGTNKNKIIILAISVYCFNIYLYKIGLFGRMVSEEYFTAGEGFKGLYFIRVISKLSYATFFFFSLNKFRNNTKSNKYLFYFSLIAELFFGFIYGARSAFIFPILIIIVAYYFVNRKISKYFILIVLPLTLLASVTIVLSYKNFTLESGFTKTSSIFELLGSFSDFQKNSTSSNDESLLLTGINVFFKNTNYLQESSMLIRYSDLNPNFSQDRARILKQIAKSPFDTFIPKYIQGKNDFSWGLWLKNEVMDYQTDMSYSLACSAGSFLYYGGGYILVMLGFLIYGIVIRMVYSFLSMKNDFILLFYLLLIADTYQLESFYIGYIINYTRDLLIMPLILWILFSNINKKSDINMHQLKNV